MFAMTTARYYRQEAKHYRERATAATDPARAEQMLRFASEYDALADLVEGNTAPSPRGAVRQQPMQQQQQKKIEDDK